MVKIRHFCYLFKCTKTSHLRCKMATLKPFVPDSGTMQRLGAMVRSWNAARLGARLDWSIPCGCCPRCLPRATDSSPSRCSLAEYALGGLLA